MRRRSPGQRHASRFTGRRRQHAFAAENLAAHARTMGLVGSGGEAGVELQQWRVEAGPKWSLSNRMTFGLPPLRPLRGMQWDCRF